MKILMTVTLAAALAGCAPPPKATGPSYGADAYKTTPPRSEAFYAVCAKRGGQVIGQDCVTQSASGSIIIPIFEDETK